MVQELVRQSHVSSCEWGHRDVMDEKIGSDDLNLESTDVIYKGRGEMGGNAGPLPHAGLKCMGHGRMTTSSAHGRTGSRILLQPDGGGPEGTRTNLTQSGVSSGITEGR